MVSGFLGRRFSHDHTALMTYFFDQPGSLGSTYMVGRVASVFGADVVAEVFEVQGRFGLPD